MSNIYEFLSFWSDESAGAVFWMLVCVVLFIVSRLVMAYSKN